MGLASPLPQRKMRGQRPLTDKKNPEMILKMHGSGAKGDRASESSLSLRSMKTGGSWKFGPRLISLGQVDEAGEQTP